ANITALDEARTIGARAVGGPGTSNTLGGGEALLASRLCSNEPGDNANDPVDGNYCYRPNAPLWDIAPITHYPFNGSAIAIFDSGPDGATRYGTDPPPPSDVPPPDTANNQDPHEGHDAPADGTGPARCPEAPGCAAEGKRTTDCGRRASSSQAQQAALLSRLGKGRRAKGEPP